MKKANRTIISLAVFFSLFLAMLLFFCKLHPIMVLDSDDWWYMGHFRLPVPLWGYQNPIKAFPEYFLPLTDYFAGRCIMPLTGNLFTAISLVDGVLVSDLIALYFFLFFRFMCKLTGKCADIVPVTLTLLFAVLHFSIFVCQKNGNSYLFLAVDQTTYFHYMIPDILNSIIVLWLMNDDILTDYFSKSRILRKILFLPLAYFSIFSNVFCCIISAAWVGCSLLFDALHDLRREGILLFIRRRVMKFLFLLTWLTAQIFEMNGNRAAELSAKNNFSTAFLASLQNFCRTVAKANRGSLLILCLVIVLFFVWIFVKRDKTGEEDFRFCIPAAWLAGLLALIYIALICSKAGAWYITRPDASFGIYFYLFTAVLLMGARILSSGPKIVYAFFTAFAILLITTASADYKESNQGGYDAETCLRIDNDIVDQFTKVYNNGGNSLALYVPKYQSEDNWPLALYSGDYYSFAFHNMGMMHRFFYVDVVPSEEKNLELKLK